MAAPRPTFDAQATTRRGPPAPGTAQSRIGAEHVHGIDGGGATSRNVAGPQGDRGQQQDHEWDWAGAEAAYQRALELSPNDATHHWEVALLLTFMGRGDEGLAWAQRALRLDPLNQFSELVLGWVLMSQGRVEEAAERIRNAGPLPPAKLGLWGIYVGAGRYEEALAEATAYYRMLGNLEVVQALQEGWREAFEEGGSQAFKGAMVAGARALEAQASERYVQPTQVARLYTYAGDSDLAFHWLEQAFEERDPQLTHLKTPGWESLQSDPRFEDLVRRLGFPTPR